jgi:hypothetical protein
MNREKIIAKNAKEVSWFSIFLTRLQSVQIFPLKFRVQMYETILNWKNDLSINILYELET